MSMKAYNQAKTRKSGKFARAERLRRGATRHVRLRRDQQRDESAEIVMLRSRGERGAFSRTPRRITRAHVHHHVQAASSQKSLNDSPTQPRPTFYHEKLHQCGVNEMFHSSAICLTRPSRSASLRWATFCVRCSQLQPLSVQLCRRVAKRARLERAWNARSNGEETRSNGHLARRPELSTARRHLIHEFHSCVRRRTAKALNRRRWQEGPRF